LNNINQLNAFFLAKIARYLNTFGKPIQTDLSPETFGGLSDPMKFLEMARRRQQLGEGLMQDRSTLEFHMHRIEAFKKLAQRGPLFNWYLHEWNYVVKAGGFWAKVKGFFGRLGGKFRGAFSSSRYFRMSLAQRNPAYAFYGIIIILFILLAIYVPMKWSEYKQDRLQQMRDQLTEQRGGG
jgi:hypothetical protein